MSMFVHVWLYVSVCVLQVSLTYNAIDKMDLCITFITFSWALGHYSYIINTPPVCIDT